MRDARQGEVWWASLPPPAGRRPVLILTRTTAIARLTSVTVAPLTRTIRGIQSEVRLDASDGVPTECAVSLENILTVPKAALRRRITALVEQRLTAVFDAIRYTFAMRR